MLPLYDIASACVLESLSYGTAQDLLLLSLADASHVTRSDQIDCDIIGTLVPSWLAEGKLPNPSSI